MKTIAVITCFSYPRNQKYMFNPDYVRSDLRRILCFSKNITGCSLDNIYVLTDMTGSLMLREEILSDFYDEVKCLIKELGYIHSIPKADKRYPPLIWLKHVCKRVSKYLGMTKGRLYSKLTHAILPVIRNTTVVEFAKLFTNVTLIEGRNHFDMALNDIFSQLAFGDRLFFYYTGHGVRFINFYRNAETIRDICLVIPSKNGTADFYSRDDLQDVFQQIPSNVSSLIVFDCCHAENIINLPYQYGSICRDLCMRKSSKSNMICLSSTRTDQTCGFYTGPNGCGSLFTHYLIKYWIRGRYNPKYRKLKHLYRKVEEKVLRYRLNSGKLPQNMLIGLSHPDIEEFPDWLSRDNHKKILEIIEETT